MGRGKHEQQVSDSTIDPETTPATGVPPVAVADGPFLVRAIMSGTYPDPDSIVARWRNVGDVFTVKCVRDFSNRWMKRLTDQESSEVVPTVRTIPQTTGKPRKPVPFPQP